MLRIGRCKVGRYLVLLGSCLNLRSRLLCCIIQLWYAAYSFYHTFESNNQQIPIMSHGLNEINSRKISRESWVDLNRFIKMCVMSWFKSFRWLVARVMSWFESFHRGTWWVMSWFESIKFNIMSCLMNRFNFSDSNKESTQKKFESFTSLPPTACSYDAQKSS